MFGNTNFIYLFLLIAKFDKLDTVLFKGELLQKNVFLWFYKT